MYIINFIGIEKPQSTKRKIHREEFSSDKKKQIFLFNRANSIDSRVDKSIIAKPAGYSKEQLKEPSAYNDSQFFKFYQGKIGASIKSLNPFVVYKLTEQDYENLLEKSRIKSLKLSKPAKIKHKIKQKDRFITPVRKRLNKSVASLNAPRVLLPEIIKSESQKNLSNSSSK